MICVCKITYIYKRCKTHNILHHGSGDDPVPTCITLYLQVCILLRGQREGSNGCPRYQSIEPKK